MSDFEQARCACPARASSGNCKDAPPTPLETLGSEELEGPMSLFTARTAMLAFVAGVFMGMGMQISYELKQWLMPFIPSAALCKALEQP